MLSKVSWGDYVAMVVILLVIYYLYIGSKYYMDEIKAFLKGKLTKKAQPSKDKQIESAKAKDGNDDFDELESVVNDLRYAVLDRAGNQVTKQELLDSLKIRLAKYNGLTKAAYRVAINNYIITHAQEICGVTFHEDELNVAWDSLTQ